MDVATLAGAGTPSALLMANETMILDAGREMDGLVRLHGGRVGDILMGGALNDPLHCGLRGDVLAGCGEADSL